MYIYIYIACMNICMYILHVCVYTSTYLHLCLKNAPIACKYSFMYVCMYVCMHDISTFVFTMCPKCLYILFAYVCMHACMCVCVYVCTHIHTCVYRECLYMGVSYTFIVFLCTINSVYREGASSACT